METSQGYSPPVVQQFSVFLDNRVGKLHDLLKLFEDDAALQMCALSVVDASDYAVVRIITSNSEVARRLLRGRSLAFSEMSVLIVELGRSHSLTSLCLYLLNAELNIRFAYPLMLRPNGNPTIAIAVDDHVLAGQILRKKNFTLLGEADLPHPSGGEA